MEFSYRISEAEYLSAAKPKSKRSSSYIKAVLFWLVILAFLVLVLSVVPPRTQQILSGLTHVPILVLLLGLTVLIPKLQPMILRRRYRKDPSMQGRFTVNITPESISIENAAGTSSRSGWNDFFLWYEAEGVIVLVSRSKARSILIGLAGLSEAQRDDLRGILTASLRKIYETGSGS